MDLLRHLHFFVAVAQERHFGQAADVLGMTQPPLSQGIRRLEDRLGVRLFDRDPGGVRMTRAGAVLLPKAEHLIGAAEEFVADGQWLARDHTVRLGVAHDLDDLAGDLSAHLHQAVGQVHVVMAGSTDLMDLLGEGSLDLAVVRHPGVVDGMVAGPVHTLPCSMLGGDDASWSRSSLPFAVPPRRWQPAAHDQFVDLLRRAGHNGDVVEHAEPTMRRALARSGSALTVVPRSEHHDVPGEPGPPLRVRIVRPVLAERRPGDLPDRAADLAEQFLAAAGEQTR